MKDVGGEFNSNMSHILKHYVPGTVLVNWDPKSFKKMRDSFVCLFVCWFIHYLFIRQLFIECLLCAGHCSGY